ncbi:hypothetical protein HanIR_Chr02g0087671 [Helianthus annuus]|nr:hypothetical protein HanIR_Chr02g0087671 [Helianthus annuus]
MRLRNEDDVAASSRSRCLGSLRWTLGCYALDVVLMFQLFFYSFFYCFGCLKLDSIDLLLC